MKFKSLAGELPYYREITSSLPTRVDDLEREDIFSILMLISIVFSLILWVLFAILDLITSPISHDPASSFVLALIHLVICPVFSYGLLIAYYGMKKGLRKTVYISGFISSLVLIVAGGFWASIGGGLAFITTLLYLIKSEGFFEI
jgi:hypothetical protein